MMGTATVQADLWSQHAQDWADVMEGWNGWGLPVYRHVLERVPVDSASRVLDVGCGAGRFCRIAADRGASVAGLDATPAFVEIARTRTPSGDFRVGDMEELPWDDDTFDLVTGFNSFFIAGDLVAALKEAARVARPGGHVAMSVFGRPDRCYSTTMFESVSALLPPKPAGAGGGPGLHDEGVLERCAEDAGMTPVDAAYVGFAETYPDLDTLLRGVMAAPPMVRAAQAVGRDAVRDALAGAFRQVQQPDGTYSLDEEVRCLIASV